MSELLDLDEADAVRPLMQKLFVAGNILPSADLSVKNLKKIVSDLSDLTDMNIFSGPTIKTPESYDAETVNRLGKIPEDVNISWMWDDLGGQIYVFPTRAFYTTIDLYTCKQFEYLEILKYLLEVFSFRENMKFCTQTNEHITEWKFYYGES